MTAPHGPSQQEVIRQSMREAGLSPNMITIAECHGTGERQRAFGRSCLRYGLGRSHRDWSLERGYWALI